MTITGLAIAKGLAIAGSVAGTTIAAAHMGNVIGLTNALNHVPAMTHAHTVITNLLQKRQ